MTRSSDPYCVRPSRREALKGMGMATAASLSAALGSRALATQEPVPQAVKSASDAGKRQQVSGIDPKNLVDEFARRELGEVSDTNLCQQVAAIISNPPTKGGNSFTLAATLVWTTSYRSVFSPRLEFPWPR